MRFCQCAIGDADPTFLVGRGIDADDPRIAEILAAIRRCMDESRPLLVDVTPDMRPRVLELETALRAVLEVVDDRGYMPPVHQRVLGEARRVLGGGR
jgi:hypothetical protein